MAVKTGNYDFENLIARKVFDSYSRHLKKSYEKRH